MNQFDLDQTLLELPFKLPSDDTLALACWTVRHAVEGVQIFGGIGSGKTSGSGRMLALKYLTSGFGGLVLTAKPDEKALWQQYCKLAGREQDLVILEPGSNYRFNFLAYEAHRSNSGHGDNGNSAITENLVEVLKTVIRAGEDQKGAKGDDVFWETALDMLIFNVIDLCQLAYGTVSVERMYEIVQSIPTSDEVRKAREEGKPTYGNGVFARAMRLAKTNLAPKVRDWEDTFDEAMKELCRDNDFFNEEAAKAIPEARLLQYVEQFFSQTLGSLHERTRSIIDFSFSGFLFRLLREPIYSLFCQGESTVTPEMSLEGKIILVNLPVKTFHKVGRDCQILFKYCWQRAMERRDTSLYSTPEGGRPVFLWADEAQNFLHEHDAVYQATARSSRICTVYISQNLPNYYASMGGDKYEHRVQSFLGTLGTKIFHANADVETNDYASRLIGDLFFYKDSRGRTMSGEFSISANTEMVLERAVRPEQFVALKTGGPENRFLVKAIFHRQGDPLFGLMNHNLTAFKQNYEPEPATTETI